MKKAILILISVACSFTVFSQSTDEVLLKGKVLDENGQPVTNTIIINKTTKQGSFGRPDGTFSVRCQKPDTLTITALGFHARNISAVDSAVATEFFYTIYLETRLYRMAEVQVFAQRDLEEIQEDINRLGYNENDYMLSGINAMQSPITFLYQQFSRKEQSKRLAIELENQDRKRELLKELFQHYVDYQIIELGDEEFDDFINYLNISDDFLKNSSQYDFLIYVRDRFRDYKIYRRQSKTMKESDFEYDKD